MSMNGSSQTTDKESSLLRSDAFHRILGGDALQALRCGICLEFFEVPIVLPCGHTFCLSCLTELCRQAIQTTTATCPLQEVRIGCPHCQVLIYASPILDRNVTCNFVIQSLIEGLKERKLDTREQLNKAVNTDEARIGSKIRLVGDLEIDRITQEVDRLSDAIGKRSVLDMAYFEVDQIRREHLASEGIGRVTSAEDSISRVGSRNYWKTGKMNRASQVQAGLHFQQQKQWAHLMQQQKCAQQFLSRQEQQQQQQQSQQQQQQQQHQQPHYQHHYKQQLQQRSSQREPIRAPGSAWSQRCIAQSWRFAPPVAESSSFPGQPSSSSSSSSTVFPTTSSSLATAFSVAPLHTSLTCLRQQHKAHQVHPALQQQRQLQLLQRQEQQQQQPPQQLLLQQQPQQPQTSQSLFQIRRRQELHQSQQQPHQQQLQQDHEMKQQQQQYSFQQQQQQQNKSHRLLQRPVPYQAHPIHAMNQYNQQHQQQQQQQQQQPQQLQKQEEQTSGSKMAAVMPVQRSGGVDSNESVSSGHTGHVGHPARLDNDPAVMSYSYRAEPVSAAVSSNLP